MALIVFAELFAWIYEEGVNEFLKAWRNLHWFFYHFFSVPLIGRTLFKPLKRLQEKYGRGFDPEKFFENLVINTAMRFVGFFARIIILILAAISQIIVLIIGAAFFTLFLTAPLFIITCLIYGFSLITA